MADTIPIEDEYTPVVDLTAEPVAQPDWIAPKPRDTNFILRGKNYFLTYPQCPLPKESVMENVKALPNIDTAVVAHELHEDGHDHLHVYFTLTKQYTKRGYKWLDDLAPGYHGNYQLMRKPETVLKYVVKDGDYISFNIDPAGCIAAAEKHTTRPKSSTYEFAQKMKDDATFTLDNMDDIDPAWVFHNKRKAQEYLGYQQMKRSKVALLSWPQLDATGLRGPTLRICKWLLKNIRVPRVFKQKQLYVCGPPNKGKTHFVEQMKKYLAIYTLPKSQYVDGYEEGRFDLVVVDEFKAHFTVQFLNEFLQGSTMYLNQKGTHCMKTANIPVIILSNFTLEECYSKKTPVELSALRSRLKIVEIGDGDAQLNLPL